MRRMRQLQIPRCIVNIQRPLEKLLYSVVRFISVPITLKRYLHIYFSSNSNQLHSDSLSEFEWWVQFSRWIIRQCRLMHQRWDNRCSLQCQKQQLVKFCTHTPERGTCAGLRYSPEIHYSMIYRPRANEYCAMLIIAYMYFVIHTQQPLHIQDALYTCIAVAQCVIYNQRVNSNCQQNGLN